MSLIHIPLCSGVMVVERLEKASRLIQNASSFFLVPTCSCNWCWALGQVWETDENRRVILPLQIRIMATIATKHKSRSDIRTLERLFCIFFLHLPKQRRCDSSHVFANFSTAFSDSVLGQFLAEYLVQNGLLNPYHEAIEVHGIIANMPNFGISRNSVLKY